MAFYWELRSHHRYLFALLLWLVHRAPHPFSLAARDHGHLPGLEHLQTPIHLALGHRRPAGELAQTLSLVVRQLFRRIGRHVGNLVSAGAHLADAMDRPCGEYSRYVQSSPAINQLLAEIMPGDIALIITLLAALAAVLFWLHAAPQMVARKLERPVLVRLGWVPDLFLPSAWHLLRTAKLFGAVGLLGSCRGTKPTRQTVIFWFIPLVLSWAIFVVSKWYLPTADKWPVLYNLIFLIWLYRSQSKATAIPAPNAA